VARTQGAVMSCWLVAECCEIAYAFASASKQKIFYDFTSMNASVTDCR
jgi:hypothetical protein